jgi:Brp/Blh family beta-carotene 15,15'-monooxygenase
MSKYTNFAIVASFLGIWISSLFINEFQILVGFILIFSFGILHGANDLLLIKQVNTKKNTLSFYKILSYYVVVVVTGAILFYILPWLALLLFIIVSGYHFGEQHWDIYKNTNNRWITNLFQFNYGIFILLLLFVFHSEEVKKIVFQITRISFSNFNIAWLLLGFGISLLFFGCLMYVYNEVFKKQIIINIFYLVVFTIIFKTSTLIWGFALYFVLWHSIPSIIEQLKFLYGESNFNNFKSYFRTAFVYWILSLIGIAVLYFLFKDKEIFDAMFFSFLAAITFPHALVILKMFEKK